MKCALQDISAGLLENVLKRIQDKQLELNINSALKLVISCCTICSKNKHKIPARDLCSLIGICSAHIKQPNEIELTNYLQSLYYILKYLLERDFFVLSLLEDVLTAKFLPTTLTEKQSQVIICISNLIYNAVFNEVKSKNALESQTVRASIISLKLLANGVSISEFLERTHTFIQIFAIPNVTFPLLYDFYKNSLIILKTKFTEKSDVFKTFLSVIRLLMKAFGDTFTAKELQTLVDITVTTLNEYCNSKEHCVLLKIIKNISKFISGAPSVGDLQDSYNDFKSSVQLFGLTENVFTTCQTISTMLMKVCRYYNKNCDKIITVELQLILYKILKKAAVFMEKAKTQCTCSKNCKSKNGVVGSVNLLYVVAYLCKFSLSKNMKSKELLKEALLCLEMSCRQIVFMKENGCYWQTLWMEMGCVFYNTGVVLYNSNDDEALTYFHTFMRYLIKLEGTSTCMIKDNALDTALLCYIEMCNKRKDYVNGMKMAALRILLNPDNCDVAFTQWINAKSAIDDNQTITVIDMLQLAKTDIEILLPALNINEETAEKLLVAELEHYKTQWPSKIPMMSVFSKLYSFIGVSKAARLFVKIWSNTILSVTNELTELLGNLLKDYELIVEKADLESNLILACLCYCLYKYRTESMILKNSSEIKRNTTVIKQPLPPYETPLNPNDECDIATLCRHLTCDSQMKTKQFLDRSLDIFEQYCSDLKVEHLDFLKSFQIADVLIRIGYEYQLHSYSSNCLRLWTVVLKFARVMRDDLLVLKALTGLLESELNTDWLNLATETLHVLNGCESSSKKWEILVDFHITLSQKYLSVENISAAFKEFQTAQKCYAELCAFSNNDITKAKLLLLHFKFILLPCNYKLVDHNTDSVVKIHQALKLITNYFNGPGRKLPNAITVLFDIAFSIAQWYRWLYLPREVRCYTRDVAVLSQQLVSPLRAARFLVVLAHADLLSCRIDGCRSKILGISTILCLPKQQYEVIKDINAEKTKEDLEIVHVLSNELEELSLDLPLPKKNRNSPITVKDTFKLPVFLGHPRDCVKYCCNCLEYQELTVMQAHLEALVSLYINDSSTEVQEYFEGSLCLLRNFYKRGRKPEVFWEIHANILLDYGNILLKAGQRKYAERINTELVNIASNKKLSNLYLYNAAQLQKLNIVWNHITNNDITRDEEEDEITTINGALPKTPELKVSTITVTHSLSPNQLPSVTQVYSKRKLFFTITPESGSSNPIKAKTPVKTPPTIKIYPAEVETTKKKRPTTVKAKNKEVKSSILAVESTSSDVKAEKLRSKTKLLTERIKKEVKVENSTRARKNLASELATSASTTKPEGNETARKGVVTRKSSRNSKI